MKKINAFALIALLALGMQAAGQNANGPWVGTFELDVFNQGILSVSPKSLSLTLLSGESNTGFITLTNSGTTAISYEVIFPDDMPTSTYLATDTYENLEGFDPGITFNSFTDWIEDEAAIFNEGRTATMDIDFPFSPFDVTYTNFSVNQYGAIALSTIDNSNIDEPKTNSIVLTPYSLRSAVDQSTVRYKQSENRLIVAWGNGGTGLELQAWIDSDGSVRFLYEQGIWEHGTIGLEFRSGKWITNEDGKRVASFDTDSERIFDHTPGAVGRDCLLLTPTLWMSVIPSSGTLEAQESQKISFLADGTVAKSGNYVFTPTIVGENGSSSDIDMDVHVLWGGGSAGLEVSNPFEFNGPAGSITYSELMSPPKSLLIVNSWYTKVRYEFINARMRDAGYIEESLNDVPWNSLWRAIPPTADTILTDTELDKKLIDIGFPIMFFGRMYTNLVVNVGGSLSLGEIYKIAPYPASLVMNNSSRIMANTNTEKTEFTVTWEGLSEEGSDNNQTFQVVLYRTGAIRFNYNRLTGSWMEPDAGLLKNDFPIFPGLLINEDSATTTTNYVYDVETNISDIGWKTYTTNDVVATNVVTEYVANANRTAFQFVPAAINHIYISPYTGTLPAGFQTSANVIGDAKSMTPGSVSTNVFDVYLESVLPYRLDLTSDSDSYVWTQTLADSGPNRYRRLNEYYLTRSDGTGPGFGEPTDVWFSYYYYYYYSYVDLKGSAGSLSEGQWAWGSNEADELDFNTIYVRLSGDSNPETSGASVAKSPFSDTLRAVSTITFTADSVASSALGDPTNSGGSSGSLTDALVKSAWGSDDPTVRSTQNSDGSRTLSWPAATDILSHTYAIWYTTSLSDEWQPVARVTNGESYLDNDEVRNAASVIFYKVTVE